MHLFRHFLLRRITLFTLLTWGLVTQVAVVYACESDPIKKQLSCCCDDTAPSKCNQDKKCNSHLGSDTLNSANGLGIACCDVSYGINDASMVSSITPTTQQVALLTASQPPPFLPSNLTRNTSPVVSLSTQTAFLSPAFGTYTYLHTQRLRI